MAVFEREFYRMGFGWRFTAESAKFPGIALWLPWLFGGVATTSCASALALTFLYFMADSDFSPLSQNLDLYISSREGGSMVLFAYLWHVFFLAWNCPLTLSSFRLVKPYSGFAIYFYFSFSLLLFLPGYIISLYSFLLVLQKPMV